MKKNFVLIAALIAALTVAFVSCGDDGVVAGTGDKTPQVQQFDLETGMTTGISAQGSATFGSGIISFEHVGQSTYDDGSAFTLDLTSSTPAATGTATITIKYIVKVKTGTPKLTLKNAADTWIGGDATSAANDGGIYQDLKAGEVATLVIKAAGYTSAPKFAFQRNGDTNAFFMKIISVTVTAGT